MDSRTDSIGSNDVVLFVSPTMYSLDPEDYYSPAIYDEDIVEDNSQAKRLLKEGKTPIEVDEVMGRVVIGKKDKK